jgi:hypothetical protein
MFLRKLFIITNTLKHKNNNLKLKKIFFKKILLKYKINPLYNFKHQNIYL